MSIIETIANLWPRFWSDNGEGLISEGVLARAFKNIDDEIVQEVLREHRLEREHRPDIEAVAQKARALSKAAAGEDDGHPEMATDREVHTAVDHLRGLLEAVRRDQPDDFKIATDYTRSTPRHHGGDADDDVRRWSYGMLADTARKLASMGTIVLTDRPPDWRPHARVEPDRVVPC